MSNQPYAWINVNNEYTIIFDDAFSIAYPDAWMPLYSHPTKELTNEEISDIRDQFFAPKDCNIYTFARALLKKAQEND
jgi:hypothetical protein